MKIKFRAWDKYEKRFLSEKDKEDNLFIENFEVTTWNYIKLMQYTGLKDKNGTEIFEGDIVELQNGEKGFVEYSNGSFAVETDDTFWLFHELYLFNEENELGLKIIGNIFQNKDLLEEE